MSKLLILAPKLKNSLHNYVELSKLILLWTRWWRAVCLFKSSQFGSAPICNKVYILEKVKLFFIFMISINGTWLQLLQLLIDELNLLNKIINSICWFKAAYNKGEDLFESILFGAHPF